MLGANSYPRRSLLYATSYASIARQNVKKAASKVPLYYQRFYSEFGSTKLGIITLESKSAWFVKPFLLLLLQSTNSSNVRWKRNDLRKGQFKKNSSNLSTILNITPLALFKVQEGVQHLNLNRQLRFGNLRNMVNNLHNLLGCSKVDTFKMDVP